MHSHDNSNINSNNDNNNNSNRRSDTPCRALAWVQAWLLAWLAVLAPASLPAAAAQGAAPSALAGAGPQALTAARIAAARHGLQQEALNAGLDAGSDGSTDFVLLASTVDPLGLTHARFQQRLRGVPLFGAVIVTHTGPDGRALPATNQLAVLPPIDTAPRISQATALAIVERDLRRVGPYSSAPLVELVLYPLRERTLPAPGGAAARRDATMVAQQVRAWRLAYQLRVALNSVQDGGREMRYFVDAVSGAILDKWPERLPAHVLATDARSIFNGAVAINTNSVADGFELRDMQRGLGGRYGNNVVLRYLGPDRSAIFTDSGNTWGDGKSFIPGSPDAGSDDTAQSGAADVAYATAVTWDMYRDVFGRHGYDGQGGSVHAIVHVVYGFPYSTGANASWGSLCECMRFGYGDGAIGLKNIVDLDVVAHELTHGMVQKTAGLVYRGEPGGLNEGLADIFGLAAKFYAREGGHARGATSVEAGAAWTFGEGLGHAGFKRYFIRPSMEAGSFDAWDSGFVDPNDAHDVHRISGPVRRAFAFMSLGAEASGESHSPYLDGAMPGIGIDKTLRIWYRALAYYMTPLTDFAAARQALSVAARDLYGTASPEEAAVWNAFAGINVGQPWSAPPCGRLDSSRVLDAGQSSASCNGAYTLHMQDDGNLVLASHSGALTWQAGTRGNPGAYAIMQADGNLVVYRAGGIEALWHAGSYGSPGALLDIGDDGNLALFAQNRVPLWYLRAPPAAATTQASSQHNSALETADAVAPGITGLLGTAAWSYADGTESPAYFSFTLAPGQAVHWDFVGGALRSSAWLLETFNAAGRRLDERTSTAARQQFMHANPGSTPLTVFLRIGRMNYLPIPDPTTQQFSIAVSYQALP